MNRKTHLIVWCFGFEIIVNLCATRFGYVVDGFEFHDNLAKANQVGLVLGTELPSFVGEFEFGLGHKQDSLHLKLDLQTFLIDRFKKPAALLLVNLEARPDDGVAFLFEK